MKITSLKLPQKPGCYLMKNKSGKIIYIGKAKNIRKRVASYFAKKHPDYKTKLLVKKIADIDFIVTDTEVEAYLLESKLIRKHKPKFNIDLKESLRYAYIKITDEDFPRLVSTRVTTKDGQYFGPYTDGAARRSLMAVSNRLFRLRTCKKLPKKVCLAYHIKTCDGPCEGLISKEKYAEKIKKVKNLLRGKTEELIHQLTLEMNQYSKKREYERAQTVKEQIRALKSIREKQKVELTKKINQDIINFIERDNQIMIQLFNIQKGIVSGRKQFTFTNLIGGPAAFIKQYYFYEEIPQEIIIPKKIKDQNLMKKYLSKLRGTKVQITVPQKGTKKKLLDLVYTNLLENLSENEKILIDLRNKLNLDKIPYHIECFDISNIGPKFTVGAMVHFWNGKPDKNNYRRFKIKTVAGQDDFAMMAEIVKRRYSRLKKEKARLPELIVIDGGPAQLNAAFHQLERLNLKIPIISLAKKNEEIFLPEEAKPRIWSEKDPALKLLQKIRDEAHRFAVKYHRLLREKIQ